ncbi:MAG: carbamoyltransferase HypF, partial [archaeon]|nr:carbamoyltransferase HypF [archaeon]
TDTDNQKLSGTELADERKIINRVDDSVLKFIDSKITYLRRSRGFAPMPINISQKNAPELIALGSQESNTISICSKGKVFISQHIGDTSKTKTMDFLKNTVEYFLKFQNMRPKIILCDMHPDYYTTRYAKELASSLDAKVIHIQHHIAHAYSVALENGFSSFTAISCDGSGYGLDKNIWGGEIFLFKNNATQKDARIGHLEEQMLIGGESAIKEPKKMLFAIMSKFMNNTELDTLFDARKDIWKKQINERFNTMKTTSTGRILDAASAFLGFCSKRTYTGEPAIVLENAAKNAKPYDIEPVIEKKEKTILKTTPLFEFLWENRDKNKPRLAATVHNYLAGGLLRIAQRTSKGMPIIFSGGVAYNRYITAYMLENNVIINSKVPAGDGGISFGQIGYNIMTQTD